MKTYNVVLITIDSLRADFVGYQNPRERNTPFLDKLSKTSLVYTNAIAAGIPTFFSFPSLMMGTVPFSRGYTLGIPDAKNTRTIADVLRDSGYTTLAVLADNPQLYSIYNFNRGFDVYDDGQDRKPEPVLFLINSIWKLRQHIPAKILNFVEYLRAAANVLGGLPPVHIDGFDLNKKAKAAISRTGSKPFFLWLHYQDVHYPYASGMRKVPGLLKKIVLGAGRVTPEYKLKLSEMLVPTY